MIKKKQTTNGQSPHDAKPAEVTSQTVSTKGSKQKTSPFTDGIEFLAVGVGQKGGKFLLVGKDGKYVVLSVRNLGRPGNTELEKLEEINVYLLTQPARQAFLKLAQEAAKTEPTFKVATQIGWYDDLFVLPDRVYPPQPPLKGMPPRWSRILVHLDAKDDDIHSRFYCSGSPTKSREIFQLCRGNSRLIFAAALSFVGPCCKPFSLRAPGAQFVGGADSGKTVTGVIAGATWGGVPNSTVGFGSAWSGTPNGLEEYGPALNDTLMVLDETSLLPTDPKGKQPLAFGEATMRLMQGQGKKRYQSPVDRWSAPLVSTSNASVYALLDPQRRKNYAAFTDRLTDIPPSKGRTSFFEDLHGHEDAAKFGEYLFYLATENFGHPSRVFLDRLTAELARDRDSLAAVVAGNVAKYEAAAAGMASPMRSVLRVRGYFATVYAAGCLAIRFGVLPFTEDELLAAILSCHHDHVAFVDNEVAGGPSWVDAAPVAQAVAVAGSALQPIADAVVPVTTPYDRLQEFINHNRAEFLDLREPGLTSLRFKLRKRLRLRAMGTKDECALVYVGEFEGRTEYLFHGDRFAEIAGGARDAFDLKKEVDRRRLIETTGHGRGGGVSYVVKRRLPDGDRPLFVVIRHAPKK
jgi:hypothetical protein